MPRRLVAACIAALLCCAPVLADARPAVQEDGTVRWWGRTWHPIDVATDAVVIDAGTNPRIAFIIDLEAYDVRTLVIEPAAR